MTEQTVSYRRRQWYLIAIIAVIFVAPSLMAWLSFKYSSDLPMTTVNKGHLLQQPFLITRLGITNYQGKSPSREQWVVAYLGSDGCNEACLKQLDTIKRVRLALGKDMLRVEQVVLTDKPIDWIERKDLRREQGLDTDAWLIPATAMSTLLTQVDKDSATAGIFLLDPHGNIFMSYPSDTAPNAIYKDLQRALKASRIG